MWCSEDSRKNIYIHNSDFWAESEVDLGGTDSQEPTPLSCNYRFSVVLLIFALLLAISLPFKGFLSQSYYWETPNPVFLKTWSIINNNNESVFMIFSRLTNGYKIEVDISRQCKLLGKRHLGLDEVYVSMMTKQRIGEYRIIYLYVCV